MPTREHHLPFAPEAVAFMVEQHYWPRLEAFVNGPEPNDSKARELYLHLRDALDVILGGGHFSHAVTVRLISNRKGVFWGVEKGKTLTEKSLEFRTALVLLQDPRYRALVRRCDQCQRVFLGKRAEKRRRDFCADPCRFTWHNERRSKPDHAIANRLSRKTRPTRPRRR